MALPERDVPASADAAAGIWISAHEPAATSAAHRSATRRATVHRPRREDRARREDRELIV
jgi:hypothetical protein